ncbi:hypothetical protein [Rhodospirillum sp. A1_3_36]|uniref:hypothetical protein n=1 Tax=Rhodospirillum sp. A1_3_36 TaxID=3391666 RepID=UPI0039A454CC
MNEDGFNVEVTNFVSEVLNRWCDSARTESPDAERLDLNSLAVVPKGSIPSGRIAVWQKGDEWKSQIFTREVDVLVVRQAVVDGTPQLLPLVAIELKTGTWLNTDAIDTKDTVYGALKEQHPCLMTCFILKSNAVRGVKDGTLLRNGRHFDRIITDWNDMGQAVLERSIKSHLDYAVEYWGR